MHFNLYIVTGAPGSGKSTTVEAFLRLRSSYIALDVDWLIDSASALAGTDIYSDEATWKPYNALWFEVLHAFYKNGKTPILFAPLDMQDIERSGLPAWCRGIQWLLLDCTDQTRSQRLERRGWNHPQIAEALADAAVFRESTPRWLDTSKLPPDEVAKQILVWLEESSNDS